MWAPETGFRQECAGQGNLTLVRVEFAPRQQPQCIDCVASDEAIKKFGFMPNGRATPTHRYESGATTSTARQVAAIVMRHLTRKAIAKDVPSASF